MAINLLPNVKSQYWIAQKVRIKKSIEALWNHISVLSETMKTRFNVTVTKMCNATSILDTKKLHSRIDYGVNEPTELLFILAYQPVIYWMYGKKFCNNLKVQVTKDGCPGTKKHLQKLVSQGDLADTFLNSTLKNYTCPLGTASVERSFSTMGWICNQLRQWILPENLAHCNGGAI